MIDQQLAAFLHDGVGIHIGTRNQELEPNGARAIAARVEADGVHLLIFISDVAARRVMPDLQANGLAAVVFARPRDERACQVKGTFVSSRPITDVERTAARAQWLAFMDALEYIGIPAAAAATWVTEPDLTIRMKVTAIFEQTPGPQAGQAIA
jgi:hypothetical protein